MKLDQFKQLNLVGIINRANELLENIDSLGVSRDSQENIVALMKKDLLPGDYFEAASIALVEAELIERWIRDEDPSVEKFPAGWEGGIRQQFILSE